MMLAILFVALGTALAAASPIVSNQPVNGETAITGPIAGKKPPPSLGFCYNMCGPDFRHCQQVRFLAHIRLLEAKHTI